ncbi:patatin-like phospholipase family protein [Clostridium saccharoperbutylacetonicum]|uniref:patatin-like phospholipase family protein n=1 Tax=Clostridium saccharoperbutylacetonicum TaxID=36745 RepID=UPI000983E3AD|nr:patatin-like phospholipase family protein [Clostridium saccharoperbutylacetonicum]AQR94490.1 patatin-like phospholipase [Clostridium saccharoperbutylacetonicum]NSB30326.1 NTE family protein [Clostridium saccharoperbutylacetonicum]
MSLYNPKITETKFEDKVAIPEALVFSGGGIKGLAYVGAIKALEEKKLFQNVKRFAGASAGAITAALLAIGMNANELDTQMSSVDFATFLQKSNVNIESLVNKPLEEFLLKGIDVITDEVRKQGLCDGSVFLEWLISMFKLKGFDETTTFAQLYEKTGNELIIVLCCANYSKTVLAWHKNDETANMSVVTAVRGSMSIPFVFEPLLWNNNTYVDGGTMYNYPIEVFDEEISPKKTLGFILSTQSSILTPKRKEDNGLLSHLACIYDAIMNVSYEYCFRMENHHRTVFIDPAGVGTLDFKLTDDQKNALKDNGYKATMNYFGNIMKQ